MQGVIMHETHNAHDEHDEMQHDARMNATNKTNHTTKLGIAGSLLERRSWGVTLVLQKWQNWINSNGQLG